MFSSSSSALVLAAACGLVLSTSVASAAATAASDPITCQGNECGACVDANIPIVGDQSICVNFTITGSNDDPDIDLSINLDGKPIYDKNVDIGDLEKGLCADLPSPLNKIGACVKFENFTLNNGDFTACVDLDLQVGGQSLKDFKLGCVKGKIPTFEIATSLGDDPISCEGNECGACVDANIPIVGDQSICVNFTIAGTETDPVIDLSINLDGKSVYDKSVDIGDLEKGLCADLPSPLNKIGACVKFEDWSLNDGNFSLCVDLDLQVGGQSLKDFKLGCVKGKIPTQ